jgi:hypothetical protein
MAAPTGAAAAIDTNLRKKSELFWRRQSAGHCHQGAFGFTFKFQKI